MVVETLRTNDDFAGSTYAVADGLVLGTPGLLFADVTDTPYGYDNEIIGQDGNPGGSACFASDWVDYLEVP